MKQAAWSAWFHLISTDENPMHDLCDPDHCQLYNNFEYDHQLHSLPHAVCIAIKPAYTGKKKVFYQTIKGSSPGHTGRSFFGFEKRRFRTKLQPNLCNKWFRIEGSVRNLHLKKFKKVPRGEFRTKLLHTNFKKVSYK